MSFSEDLYKSSMKSFFTPSEIASVLTLTGSAFKNRDCVEGGNEDFYEDCGKVFGKFLLLIPKEARDELLKNFGLPMSLFTKEEDANKHMDEENRKDFERHAGE